MWHIYIAKCADGTLYTGITTDIERRMREHNSDTVGAKYTRARRPLTLVYTEDCETRSEASKREACIKKLSRSEKERLFKK